MREETHCAAIPPSSSVFVMGMNTLYIPSSVSPTIKDG